MMKRLILVLSVFFTILLITAPIRQFKDVLYPNFDPQDWPFISSTGFLNKFLAGHSFEIFIAMFIILNSFKLWIVRNKTPLLPITETANSNLDSGTDTAKLKIYKSDLQLFKQIETTDPTLTHSKYILIELVKLLLIFTPIVLLIVWFFGPSIFERIHYATGGFCIDHLDIKYYGICVRNGFKYVGGFKCSGHSLITCTFSTCLFTEALGVLDWIDYITNVYSLPFTIKRMGNFVVLSAISISLCWMMMFVVTCMFYHTFAERIVGTTCASSIVLFVYIRCKL